LKQDLAKPTKCLETLFNSIGRDLKVENEKCRYGFDALAIGDEYVISN
jgi:hypothetical protein